MKNKVVILLLLFVPFQAKPVFLEAVASAIIVGKVVSTKTVQTMGAVLVGYFLNTAAGKRMTAECARIFSQKLIGNYQINNFQLRSLSSGPSVSKNICNLTNVKSWLIDAKQRFVALNPYKTSDSKINLFYNVEHNVADTGFRASTVASSSVKKTLNSFRSACYGQANSMGKESATVTNVMAQQVRGFFPKIENHFHGENHWKGVAHGSFASWLAAWYLSSNDKNKSEKAR